MLCFHSSFLIELDLDGHSLSTLLRVIGLGSAVQCLRGAVNKIMPLASMDFPRKSGDEVSSVVSLGC
jgi:hypothetical protein